MVASASRQRDRGRPASAHGQHSGTLDGQGVVFSTFPHILCDLHLPGSHPGVLEKSRGMGQQRRDSPELWGELGKTGWCWECGERIRLILLIV